MGLAGLALNQWLELLLTAGMIMTACDAGIRKLDIVGPPDTPQNLATLRASVYRCVASLCDSGRSVDDS